jgi:hypothetical protein
VGTKGFNKCFYCTLHKICYACRAWQELTGSGAHIAENRTAKKSKKPAKLRNCSLRGVLITIQGIGAPKWNENNKFHRFSVCFLLLSELPV